MDAEKSCMSRHCGYKGEVEALIHATAEVDNKWVIEKGLRGRILVERCQVNQTEGRGVSDSRLTESST